MIVGVKRVRIPQKDTLANLLEKYEYELSQYDKRPFNAQGLFNYEYLNSYFIDENRYAYFIYSNGNLAGFALINKIPECAQPCDWSVAEFFIAYPYRRKRIATRAMVEIFRHHVGSWHIKYNNKNIAGVNFWNNIAQAVAKNKVEVFRTKDFYDNSLGKVLMFET